jgi:transcriptional regulator with PAS, ATPase and Fis domain
MPSVSLPHISMDRLMRSALDGVFVIDRQRRYVLFNEVCSSLTGYSLAEVEALEPCCGDLVNCHDRLGRSLKGVLCPATAIFTGNMSSICQRMEIHRKDGSTLMVETVYSPVPGPNGEAEFVVGVMRKLPQCDAEGADRSFREIPSLAGASGADLRLDKLLSNVEAAAIRRALRVSGGHRHKAALLLGISRSRLYRRMEVLQIDPDSPK